MAAGVARSFGAEAAVAVTGIAGPDGGTVEKPVGTVWIAALWHGQGAGLPLRLSRASATLVRRRAAQAALDALRRVLVEEG